MKKYLEAGKIINTHGVKGEVKIHSWTDSAEFLMKFKHLYIDEKPFKLVSSRVHKSFLIAQLEGISDVNDAMVLKNKTVFIDRSDVDLPEGSFFLQDIIGASVVDESGTELGKLTDVLEMPASNVYVVTGEREILIPAVPQFIIKTDVDAGVVTVRLIEGM
ncbi:MAG: ribosome maturation factor RimM [Oscillospiraceae bacterium]|jgi:16S rRNA processing protein RimM